MSIAYTIYKYLPFGFLKKGIRNLLKTRKAGSTSRLLREIFKKDHGIEVGYGTYGGCFDEIKIPSGVTFGNYCSIAEGVKIFRTNHPIDSFTSHPLFYNPIMGYVKEDRLERPPLVIGHDVWIGANVIILPSVSYIGNGAVIGAGSILTKDVEPYTKVAGNPARVISKRFNENQIEILENLQWWNRDYETLCQNYELLQKKISFSPSE